MTFKSLTRQVKNMKRRDFSLPYVVVLVLIGLSLDALQAKVRVWEEPLVLPTYQIGAPDHNPRFYAGRAYQGAQGRVYPYPMIDSLSDHRIDKTYKAVYLENEYIKVCILPEIGGRILSAVDKTNGYEFFYRQTVIKPALIGMIGAWISGGVEWNFPHHHRPSVFMPVDYTFAENSDGSATVWVGELEIRHRMRWIIALTVYPGRSYLEATLQPINHTPFIQSFLFFANVGTHANEHYQVFFPPGTEYATYHGKNQFAHWPISHEVYNEIDYTEGVDASWWKNHPEWTSMFAWSYEDDFFGGYDHGKEAGTVSVANHHVAPGKKFWEWSAGPRGKLWDHILTEKDGPELELMTGAYSDNQPDYSWLQPLESKIVRIVWFPIRELQGLKFASLEGAVNLEGVGDGRVKFALNTTAHYAHATVRLQRGEQVLFEERADVGPARPFRNEVKLPEGVTAQEIRVSLLSPSGKELLSYKAREKESSPMPDPVVPPPLPDQIQTVEELYYTGLRLEQFFNPVSEPEPYWEEALRRDSGNYRVNVALGIRNLKKGMFQDAEQRFRTAVGRATRNYTSPRDGEALYYLGLALRFQGLHNDAVKPLYQATWSYGFHSAAYYQLAEISASRGDFEEALDHVNRALATNAWSARCSSLKASILRRLGRFEESLQLTRGVLDSDPLNFWAGNEHYLARKALGSTDADVPPGKQRALMRGEVQSYLELALDYAHGGFLDEAIEVLSTLADDRPESEVSPMVAYYLGHFWGRKGAPDKQRELFDLANRLDAKYVFPFRLESIGILREASEICSEDGRPHYYLGNLLYDLQPAVAVTEWEKSRALDDRPATLHRNLAVGYEQHGNDIRKAVASMEKAVQRDPADARLYYELDVLYEKAGVDALKRLSFLEANREILAQRDDAMSRLVLVSVQAGRYGQAIDILKERHFHVWEGSRGLRDAYVDAHLLRGLQHSQKGDFASALRDYQTALEFPLNLENAWPYRGGRMPEIYHFVATAYEALGDIGKAKEAYQESADAKQREEWSDLRYYEAASLLKLGEQDRAEQLFRGLAEFASAEPESGIGFFAKFGERQPLNVRRARQHYLLGLVHRGRGEMEQARAEFEQALALDGNHLWARIQLSRLGR